MIYSVDESHGGLRADVFAAEVTGLSRSAVARLIEEDCIGLVGKALTKNTKLSVGDELRVELPEPEPTEAQPEDIPLDVVYEDEDIIVVNKPVGMVVHPAAGNSNGTLVNALLFRCGESLSGIGGVIRPGIVHRIDKDTSGLLVVAKNDAAHLSLAKQLETHEVCREYRALVFGGFSDDFGTVDAPIGRDPKNRLRQAVTQQNSKRAVTHYKVLERLGKFTHIEARLETGRTHQIRVHMAHIKHPLLGDFVYGPEKNPYGVQGQMLHAKVLGFVHPTTGEYMEFESELPEEFQKTLNKLRNK
jgi:23S rRNA pseudouridine1911/1915/1917 synthase